MGNELRASFDEQDQYLDLLAQAYAEGRLDDGELERRRALLLGRSLIAKCCSASRGCRHRG